MTKKIVTERLELRLADLSDAAIIMNIFNDWEIIKWFQPPIVWPCNKRNSYPYLKSVLEKKHMFLFVINLKRINEDIGVIRYKLLDNEKHVYAERGFALSKKYRNKGIISEASLAGNRFFFDNTDIEEIRAYNALDNEPSRTIKKRQGFKLEGVRTAYEDYNTGCAEEEIWVLTRDQHNKLVGNN